MEGSMFTEILAAVLVFTGVIVSLVVGLMFASRKLQPSGKMKIDVNDGTRVLEVDPGDTLLSALSTESVFLPSACGGGGTCATGATTGAPAATRGVGRRRRDLS